MNRDLTNHKLLVNDLQVSSDFKTASRVVFQQNLVQSCQDSLPNKQ